MNTDFLSNMSTMHSKADKRLHRPAQAGVPDGLRAGGKPTPPLRYGAFLSHPDGFPCSVRRPSRWRRTPELPAAAADLGLSIHSDRYVPAGAELEVAIPLRGDEQRFRGEVVLVRELTDGYELGIWLATPDDAVRATLVEHICQIESGLSRRDGRLPQ